MKITGFNDKQQKILQILLREKEGISNESFTRRLGISRNATHRHMTILERDGYVQKHVSVQTKGRPGTTFILTDKGVNVFPKHYSLFAEMLINLIKQKSGLEEMIEFFRTLGASLAETKKASLSGKPIAERIELTVAIMQDLGYDAQTSETEPGQNRMIDAYNCVFHDLAYKNNEICEVDLSLLSSLLNSKIEHSCCMAKGDKLCRFVVK